MGTTFVDFLEESLVESLPSRFAVGSMVVVEVLPLLDLEAEYLWIIDDAFLKELVELLIIGLHGRGTNGKLLEDKIGKLDR